MHCTLCTLFCSARLFALKRASATLLHLAEEALSGVIAALRDGNQHTTPRSTRPRRDGRAPVVAGSRLPVATLLACIDAGDSWERLVESWPFLMVAHVEAARAYASLNDVGVRPWVSKALP